MLRFADAFPPDVELALVDWGQSNARANGVRDTEGLVEATHLVASPNGADLTGTTVGSVGGNMWTGTAGTSGIITFEETLAFEIAVGAEIRLIGQVYGDGNVTIRDGLANVVGNVGQQLSVVWVTSPPAPPLAGAVTIVNGTPTINRANHNLLRGDKVVFAGTLPAELVAGVTYYVKTTVATVSFTVAATRNGTDITFSSTGSGVTLVPKVPFYLWQKGAYETYPSVRVLTPYLPELPSLYPTGYPAWPGGANVAPGYTFPSTVTSYEDAGLFLDFSWNEGVEGVGGTEQLDPPSSADATHLNLGATLTLANFGTDFLIGALLVVRHLGGLSWGTVTGNADAVVFTGISSATSAGAPHLTMATATWITNQWAFTTVTSGASSGLVLSNTATTLTLTAWTGGTPAPGAFNLTGGQLTLAAGWSGVGIPTGATNNWLYEVALPHWRDNPRRNLDGFRYPSNESMPGIAGGVVGTTYNRPRLRFTPGYVVNVAGTPQYRFGHVLPLAWQLAQVTGRRINVIHLGINSAGLFDVQKQSGGFPGRIGWWDNTRFLDWNPSNATGSAARLKKLITTVAPAALLAEANTKRLQVIGIVGFQGETDALYPSPRAMYSRTLSAFYKWLRGLIGTTYSPYRSTAQVPVVHAQIASIPWEQSPSDVGGVVNTAISEFCVRDGFAATFDTDASPQLGTTVFGPPVPGHYNGVGEVRNATSAANLLAQLISTAAGHNDLKALDVCNLALSHIGDVGRITSLDPLVDASAQAALCARYLPRARDSLTEMRNWSFASVRTTLVLLTSSPSTEWDFGYVVPGDLLTAVAVLPPDAVDDYSSHFADPSNTAFSSFLPAVTPTAGYTPQPYAIESDQDGSSVLVTDVKNATLRYIARVVDASQWPPLFTMTLSWHLAAMLAGAVIKGEQGAAVAQQCTRTMMGYLGQAEARDANKRQAKPDHVVPWISGR